MDQADIVPYETLVRWGVVHERLERLADQIHGCADRAATIVEQLSGRYDANGQPFSARPGADPLEGLLGDAFWDQLYRDVDRRLPALEGSSHDA